VKRTFIFISECSLSYAKIVFFHITDKHNRRFLTSDDENASVTESKIKSHKRGNMSKREVKYQDKNIFQSGETNAPKVLQRVKRKMFKLTLICKRKI